MNHLDVLLTARARAAGRALRATTARHTHLEPNPLGIVVWRLGGERFRAAAIAWGRLDDDFSLTVAGEPRNRTLFFRAMVPFAAALADYFDECALARSSYRNGEIALRAPQLVVPNRSSVTALGFLGRNLAYLSDRDGIIPPPGLHRAGRHLQYVAREARIPGQALTVPLTTLLVEQWVTTLSPVERENLPALWAQISPPAGMSAFEASSASEHLPVGPEPTGEVDRDIADLVTAFNDARDRSVDVDVIAPLLGPLETRYRDLVAPVWAIMQEAFASEAAIPEAPHTAIRWTTDRNAFTRHFDWVRPGRGVRLYDSSRQAGELLQRFEQAKANLEIDRAIDDPACRVGLMLSGDIAVAQVTDVDLAHREVAKVQQVQRPLVTLVSKDPISWPVGKEIHFVDDELAKAWIVHDIVRTLEDGTRVVVKPTSYSRKTWLPTVGAEVFPTTLRRPPSFPARLPDKPPWTHVSETAIQPSSVIDDDNTATPPIFAEEVADPEAYR